MPVPRITYDALVRLFGETFVSRFYTPVSMVRR